MDIRQIDDNYSVTGQIEPDDVRDIAAEGSAQLFVIAPITKAGLTNLNSLKLRA